MTATPVEVPSLLTAVTEVAGALRMELAFLATFVAVVLASRIFDLRLDDFLGTRRRPRKAAVAVPPAEGRAPLTKRAPPSAADVSKGESRKGMVSSTSPTNVQEVLAAVQQFAKSQDPQRALDHYTRAKQSGGLRLQDFSKNEGHLLFMHLVTSAIRGGKVSEALRLLRDCREDGPGIPLSLLVSATKVATANQLFKDCLSIYDYISQDRELVIDDRSVWSCLLFCAVECRAAKLAPGFWSSLRSSGDPTYKDYGNMMRYAAMRTDWQLAMNLLNEMRESSLEIERVVYNTALAICVSAEQLEQAVSLLENMERTPGLADVITYNTLAKGYAKDGRLESCFGLCDRLRAAGLAPSQVTYGILLDCCINQNQMEKAKEVFDHMAKEGCAMNTVLYTTMIKGFTRQENVDEAMAIYQRMRSDKSGSVTPDVITFSVLVKANCDAGRLDRAFGLLESMMELKLAPDEVIFNNLIAGCVHESNTTLAKRLYTSMVEGGIKPSTATFSILIRLYTSCKMMDEALELLTTETTLRGVEAQPRLFLQLLQCCLRDRQGRRALEVYKLLPVLPTALMHGQILGTCAKLNMLDTGVEILGVAAQRGAEVAREDVVHLREIAAKKKKASCEEAISEVMGRLKLVSA